MRQEHYTADDLRKSVWKIRERDIQKQIIQYLQAKGCWVSRFQNLPVYDEKIKARRKNPYMMPGMPDIICFVPNTDVLENLEGKEYHLIAIEVKRKGEDLNDEQKEFKELWELSDNKFIVAHSLDEVMKEVK